MQGLLELADLPYVGSGVLASALAMDKAMCKQVLRAAGLRVTDWLVITRAEIERDAEAAAAIAAGRFSFPIFTKPANLGSSVGVVKAHDYGELVAGLRESARYDRRVLVEPGINAREIEVSVLGNAEPVASAVGEVVPSHEFYDYEAKYVDEGSRLIIPALIPAETAAVGPRHGGGGLQGHRRRRPGARGLSAGPRQRRAVLERDQHLARLHRYQHVSQAVGSRRPELPRPDRPPGGAGPGAARRRRTRT